MSALWLIGMMGAGKSSAGRIAAERLEVRFWDTDQLVAERLGCSVAELWGEAGEAVFRDMERVAVRVASERGGVISTGGGAVMDEASRQLMSSTGTIVWLEARIRDLLDRLGEDDSRPLLAGADPAGALEGLLAERSGTYLGMSDARIDTTGKDIEDVAAEIEALWPG